MILLPRASGTEQAPPLITVPAGAVVIDERWQTAHPTRLNRLCPAWTAGVIGPRGGTPVARRKRVKASTASPLGASAVAGSSGSAIPSSTKLPLLVLSVGRRGFVMPMLSR